MSAFGFTTLYHLLKGAGHLAGIAVEACKDYEVDGSTS
jgi:hypothetical protein